MGILAVAADERVAGVAITEDELTVRLMDGRSISVPLVWYPRLLNATEEQRQGWKVSGGGYGLHWEEIDEDLSVGGLLLGTPVPQQAAVARHATKPDESVVSDPFPVESASISEDIDTHEKGIVDHYADLEKSTDELMLILSDLTTRMEEVGSKVSKRAEAINNPTDTVLGIKASNIQEAYMQMAADISDFSAGVERILPRFEKNTQMLERSYSMYVSLVQPEDEVSTKQLRNFKGTLSSLCNTVRETKETIVGVKNEVQSGRDKNISFAMNKATSRAARALEGLITNIVNFESFVLRIDFQIDEKLGQAGRLDADRSSDEP